MSSVTSALEPLFAPVYERTRKTVDEGGRTVLIKTLVISEEYQKYPGVAEGAYDVEPRDHFHMQTVVQKHVDNAVSKTINLPEDYSIEFLHELWLDYIDQVKGSTFYRQGSRGEEPLRFVPQEEVQDRIAEFISKGLEVEWEGNDTLSCPTGICEV